MEVAWVAVGTEEFDCASLAAEAGHTQSSPIPGDCRQVLSVGRSRGARESDEEILGRAEGWEGVRRRGEGRR